ncbi:hypothetical protein RQP46_002415 [Phenoliferia psychrophenolica]
MARASFITLPLELKARIVEMTSDQENAWMSRVGDPTERAAHINCLSSIALVNKELRYLAAKHQFEVLTADRTSDLVFRFRILPRYGHCITELRFLTSCGMEEMDYMLVHLGQLSGLRTLCFEEAAAEELFGEGVTLRVDEEGASYRAQALTLCAPQITTLVLYYFKLAETVALIRTFPNLETLALCYLEEARHPDDLSDLLSAIYSRRRLRSLTVDLLRPLGWPVEALAPLKHDPPSLEVLQLTFFPFDKDVFSLVEIFASTIKTLALDLKVELATTEVDDLLAKIRPTQLPRLTHLRLFISQTYLAHSIRITTSSSTLSHFSLVYTDRDGPVMDPSDPVIVKFIASQYHPSPSSLAAYADLVRSRGLDSSVLDRLHLTPFHPSAKLDYTENESGYLGEVLGRTLDFGRIELKRMLAEGNVARALGWVKKLKPLEDERLAWKD